MYLVYILRVKDQRRTKDKPRNDLRTTNHQKVLFIKIAISFTSLIPSSIPPTDDRETTDRKPIQLPASPKALFLRLLPKQVFFVPEKVDSIPNKVYSLPEIVDILHSALIFYPLASVPIRVNLVLNFRLKSCIFQKICWNFVERHTFLHKFCRKVCVCQKKTISLHGKIIKSICKQQQ